MKKTILTLVVAVASLTASAQEDRKAANARRDVTEAQKDLREAKSDSAEDYLKFRKEAEININNNQKRIDELKAKKWEDQKETKEKYDRSVMALEEKNIALRKKMEGSESTKTSMWSAFKSEFRHDAAEIGNAFKDIGVNNEK